jgi:hypothetical protein
MEGAHVLIFRRNKEKSGPHNYKSLNDTISVDDALCQASVLLDLAAHKALSRGRPTEIKEVANAWMELGAVITSIQLQIAAQQQPPEPEPKQQTGFGPNKVKEEE